MSRELKFRAYMPDGWMAVQGTHPEIDTAGKFLSEYEAKGILMQSTGLKDKHGVEIFEGDILAVKFNGAYIERVYWKGEPDAVAEVYWDYSGFRFNCHGEKDRRFADFQDFLTEIDWQDDHGLVMAAMDHTEVIGNIYENPELLKQAAE